MSSEWLPVILTAILMAVTLVAPGYFWIRASVRSSLVAVAFAPALTFGLIAALGQITSYLSIPWSRFTVFPALLVVVALGVLWWRSHRHNSPEISDLDTPSAQPPLLFDAPASHAYRILSARQRHWMWACIALGWLLAALPTLVIALPSNPSQQWDAVFHVNGVWHILQQQDAGWWSALSSEFGGDTSVYYPSGWHIFVALFATPTTVTQTAHAASLAAMLIWVAGGAALTSVVSTSRTAALSSPVIAGAMLSMPADALTMYVQWPHATALAALPGLGAAALVWGRRLSRTAEESWRHVAVHIPLGAYLLVGVIGTAHLHASALFGFAWTFLFPFVTAGSRTLTRAYKRGDTPTAVATLLILVGFVATPIYLLTTPHLQGMGNYARSGLGWDFAFARGLVPMPPFEHTIGLTATLTVSITLMILGAFALVRRAHVWQSARSYAYGNEMDLEAEAQPRSTAEPGSPRWERQILGPRPARWLICAYLLWAFATFIAYSPEDTLRTFWLSPWYMDPRRIMGVQNMVMIPLIAIGFARLVTWIQAHHPRHTQADIQGAYRPRIATLLGLWVLTVSMGGALDARFEAATYVFDPNNLGKPGMVTSEELAMIKRIPDTLPEGAHILGDPIAGAAYVESIGQRTAFFPQLTTTYTGSPNADLFKQSFNTIHTNPQICQALREEGITHLYLDADGKYYSFNRSDRAPGLYNVDTTHGFELIDSGDNAALYRITACNN